MAWHIEVEFEDGTREGVGEATDDLGKVTNAAFDLANELGHLSIDQPTRTIVHIISDTDEIGLPIAVIPGGLVPNASRPG